MEYLAQICSYLIDIKDYIVLKNLSTTTISNLSVIEIDEGEGLCYMTTCKKRGSIVKLALEDLKYIYGVPLVHSYRSNMFHSIQSIVYTGSGVTLRECMSHLTLKSVRLILNECALILDEIHKEGWAYGSVTLDGFFVDSRLNVTLIQWDKASPYFEQQTNDVRAFGAVAKELLKAASPRTKGVKERHMISTRYGRDLVAYASSASRFRDILDSKYFRSITFTL